MFFYAHRLFRSPPEPASLSAKLFGAGVATEWMEDAGVKPRRDEAYEDRFAPMRRRPGPGADTPGST